MWGHIRFGLDAWQDGRLPVVDPYSFTQDRPQIYHEWLGAVLLGLSYSVAGAPGVLLLKGIGALGVLAVMAGWLRRLRLWEGGALAVLAASSMVPLTATTRPQIWTVLAMVLMVRLLVEGKHVWVIPLFAAWANLHGGWVMGFGILGAWCAATLIDNWFRTHRIAWHLCVLPPAALIATLLTPYGWHLWQFLAETLGVARPDIGEWHPLWTGVHSMHVPALIAIGLFVAVCVCRSTRPSLPWMFVGVLLIYSGIRVSRLLPIAGVVLTLLSAIQLARVQGPLVSRIRLPSRGALIVVLVPLFTLTATAASTVAPYLGCLRIQGGWVPDVAAIPVLRQGVDGGRIVTFFDWGEFAYWHLGPRLKISMDGRRETIYTDRILDIHKGIYENTDDGHAWLVQHRPEYVWLKARHAERKRWLVQHGYRLDWESDQSYVAVRTDLPVISGPPTIETTGCFPGP